MARPRKFVEDAAIDAAMRAFWAHGYEGTSTQDLCEATGLGRSSIYNTFASKHDLFEKALARYIELKTAAALELLAGDLPVREKVRTLLWWAVEPDEDNPIGCLVVNATVELGPHDPAAADMLRRDQEVRLAALVAAIEAGRRAGEIAADKDAESLARFVVATISGMRVMARGGADRAALESIATTALSAL
ncbi:transcriptional regulator, TetR family [Kribbella flavida DSM 17836]|uniref:Transcriptional regulator, TetR family n=1 Tax=Kribbella flavida (strain DSM 17836 / JCM 10339 / NBRC 14399) TaxID=479435 RepID=D2PUM1_KRIFD|nr:TetR/AcrR family transcriptional regulator [Kribbella flavida]ADB29539.1 transcriptional regulator, TetR family [Kribbella flavida DSM 17836]